MNISHEEAKQAIKDLLNFGGPAHASFLQRYVEQQASAGTKEDNLSGLSTAGESHRLSAMLANPGFRP